MAFRDTSDLHYWDADDDETLRRLRARFPRWRMWRGTNEHMQPAGWHASRLQAISDDAAEQGLQQTVDAATAAGLTELLDEQEWLYRLTVGQRLDIRVPNIARMYDYFLGGKDNFHIDRICAERVREHAPEVFVMAQENRAFLGRAVRYLAAEAGIDQFLDVGAGLPTQENVHQVAQKINPAARTVYVDHDPVVLTHARALLATDDHTWAIRQDVRAPEKILTAVDALGLLDLSRPVGVLLVAVLHFVTDAEDPYGIVATVMEALPAGSYLVVSHVEERPGLREAAAQYRDANAPVTLRTAEEIGRMFDGLALVDPGVVQVSDWRPDDPFCPVLDEDRRKWVCGGVGRKP
ncbi:SAM-dependent methyltransferase [Streptosporangium sp. NPDC051023]|uniref:SAM-dependent methyltransferase n=1 Tax=Streptosporangium sp. NPDC051023 TaxID=3155410 RepID=UPI00344F2F6C